MLSLFRGERRFGVRKRDPIAFLIDDEQQVALAHEVVVLHVNIINVTGYVRSNRDHVGTDAGISSPGRIEIVVSHVVAKKTGYSEEDKRKQHTYDRPHR